MAKVKKHGEEAWDELLDETLQLSGAVVDRDSFLAQAFVNDKRVKKIIKKGPIKAWVPLENIDNAANSALSWHTTKSSAKAGAKAIVKTFLPFGIGTLALKAGKALTDKAGITEKASAEMIELLPMVVAAQQLAYIYGKPDLVKNDNFLEEIKTMVACMDNDIVLQEKLTLENGTKALMTGAAQGVAEGVAEGLLSSIIPGGELVTGLVKAGSSAISFSTKTDKLKNVLHQEAVKVRKHMKKMRAIKVIFIIVLILIALYVCGGG
jgi:hypothetical protein